MMPTVAQICITLGSGQPNISLLQPGPPPIARDHLLVPEAAHLFVPTLALGFHIDRRGIQARVPHHALHHLQRRVRGHRMGAKGMPQPVGAGLGDTRRTLSLDTQ